MKNVDSTIHRHLYTKSPVMILPLSLCIRTAMPQKVFYCRVLTELLNVTYLFVPINESAALSLLKRTESRFGVVQRHHQ